MVRTTSTVRAGRRTGRILLALGALATLVALVAGVPVLLLTAWRTLGPPIPSLHELASPDDGTLFVRVLCLLGWISWATFTWALLAEIVAKILGRRLPTLHWQQRVAAGLVAAVTLAVSSPAIASATAAPVQAAPVTAVPVVQTPPASEMVTTPASSTPTVPYREHVVQPGEQMPAMAERYLGDKLRWRDIATATYGIEQPDGRTLNPGDTRVYPGWTMRIPLTTGPLPAAQRAAPAATTYEVADGDWLWHIADRFLGNPNRYPDIEALNPDLERRNHGFPDHIEAGWRLVLPTDAHDRGPRAHATGSLITPPAHTNPAKPGPGPAPGDTRPPTWGPANPPPGPATSPGSAPSPGAAATTAAPSPTSAATQASTGPTPERSTEPATAAPAASVPASSESGEDDSMLDNALLIGVPLLGAGLLAALLLTTVRRYRRRQEQHRPVGRRLPAPVEPKVETHLRVVAQPVAVERLDHALRVLAVGLADRAADQMPDIVAAWLHGDAINLLLTRPCPSPPAPWAGDALSWTLPGDIDLPDVDGPLAPLPTFAAVGSQPGMHLLLDLERLGLLAITGDQRNANDLLRYLAAELACNVWSDHVEITVAGFDAVETGELIALGGDRIDAAPTTGAAIERIRRRASQVVQSLDHLGAGDPLAGRVADIAADAWMPHVLLAKHPGPDEITALEALDSDLSATGRCAVAVAVTTTREVGRWPISVDASGRLSIPFLGMTNDDATLTAAGLPRAELGKLADLLDTARSRTPQPTAVGGGSDDGAEWPRVPAAPEVEPWAAGTDAAGALLHEPASQPDATTDQPEPPDEHDPTDGEAPDEAAEVTVDESVPHEPAPVAGQGPVPPLPRTGADTSTTVDQAARMPTVVPLSGPPARARRRVTAPVRRRHSDPTLDADLHAWTDADPTRPRIAILGPVTVEAPGQQPTERLRFYAEIIVYLAARGARGATTDQFNEALWPGQQPKAASRRVAVARARRWLGATAAGEPWLPDATADRRYSLRDGYLLDWHLFRRLRSRGESRGPAGDADLRRALGLVRGAPLAGADVAYSPVARNPYVWLPTSEIQPHHLASAVVDTAHRLVELCLDSGDITGARWAVDQAWLADPDRSSDIAWRDLLRVATAEGNTAELDQILGELIRVRDAEVPEDLDKDTYQLLCDLMPERIRAGVR